MMRLKNAFYEDGVTDPDKEMHKCYDPADSVRKNTRSFPGIYQPGRKMNLAVVCRWYCTVQYCTAVCTIVAFTRVNLKYQVAGFYH